MKKIIFLALVLLSSVQLVFISNVFAQTALPNGTYSELFVLKSYNGTHRIYKTCGIKVSYVLNSGIVESIDAKVTNDCDNGFDIESINVEPLGDNYEITIRWNYVSPETTAVYESDEFHKIYIQTGEMPSNTESGTSRIKVTKYGTQITKVGGHIFNSDSGLHKAGRVVHK